MKEKFKLFVTTLLGGMLTLLANLAAEIGIATRSKLIAVVGILSIVGLGFVLFAYAETMYFFIYLFLLVLLFLGLRARNAASRD